MTRATLAATLVMLLLRAVPAAEPDWDWAPPTKHGAVIRIIRWNPDGTRVLTTADDGVMAVWEAKTGRKLRTISSAESNSVHSLAWSGDGTRIIGTASSIKSTFVWDATSGKRIRTLFGFDVEPSCGALNRDGTLGVVGTMRGTVLVWDPQTGEIVRTLGTRSNNNSIRHIALSRDGVTAVSVARDGTITIWDIPAGKALHTLKGHTNPTVTVAISADGKTAVSGSWDRKAIVWDTKTGKPRHTLSDDREIFTVVGSSVDGSVILAGESKTLNVLDGQTGKKSKSVTFAEYLTAADLSPDGSAIAVAIGSDLFVVDAKTGERAPTVFGSVSPTTVVSWDPSSSSLFVGSLDGTGTIWGRGPDTTPRSWSCGGAVRAVSWDRDGKRILTGRDRSPAVLWDAAALKSLKSFASNTAVSGVGLSRDGSRAVVPLDENSAAIWDCKSGEQVLVIRGVSRSTAWSADDSQVLGMAGDATVLCGSDGKVKQRFGGVYRLSLVAAALNHDGSKVLACYTSFDIDVAHIWDVKSGKRVRTCEGHLRAITSACWSPDSTRFATGSRDQTIIVWDAETGKRLHTLRGHDQPVTGLSWSANGKWLASASGDGTARVWDAKTGKEVCRLLTFDSGKEWIVLGPDGAYDTSISAKTPPLYFKSGSSEPIAPEKYLTKRTPGLLAKYLAE